MGNRILPSNAKLVSNVLKTETDALEVAKIVFLANQIVKAYAPYLKIVSTHLRYTVYQINYWLEHYTLKPTVDYFDKLQANIRQFNATHHFSIYEEEYEMAMQRISYVVEAASC